MKINEGIVDLIVDTLKFNAIVYSKGNFVEFRVKLPFSKSEVSIKVQKETFYSFKKWLNDIEL